jgi:hypothetical protein
MTYIRSLSGGLARVLGLHTQTTHMEANAVRRLLRWQRLCEGICGVRKYGLWENGNIVHSHTAGQSRLGEPTLSALSLQRQMLSIALPAVLLIGKVYYNVDYIHTQGGSFVPWKPGKRCQYFHRSGAQHQLPRTKCDTTHHTFIVSDMRGSAGIQNLAVPVISLSRKAGGPRQQVVCPM